SLLGGAHCGLVLPAYNGKARAGLVALAALPPTAGWLALLPGPVVGLRLLICGPMLQCLWDALSVARGRLPACYARLRVQFTVVAVACLIIALARLIVG